MADLIVSDLVGNVEMLVNAEVTRKTSDTNEKSLTIIATEDELNKAVLSMLKI